MLKIRLQRVGKKKQPAYRFVVSESSRDMYGKHLEILGHYNPFSKVIEVNKDRILHWISVGAKTSPTVHNLLVDQNVIQADKVVASKGKKKKTDGKEAPAAETTTPAGAIEKPAEEEKAQPAKEEAKPEEKPAEEKKQ